MKITFIVANFENRKAGLYFSTYFRILYSKKHFNKIKVIQLEFIDNLIIKNIKKLTGFNKNSSEDILFDIPDVEYKKIHLSRNFYSSIQNLSILNYLRPFKWQNNEDFLSPKNIESLISECSSSDLLMAHWGYPNGRIAMQVASILKIPFYVTWHGSDINILPKKNKFLFEYIKEVLEKSACNFFVSNALYTEAIKITSSFNWRLSFNGIEENIIFRNRDDNNAENNIVFIGNLNLDKRADKLSAIIKLIFHNLKRKPTFTIIGDGPFKNKIISDLKNQNISVQVTGQINHSEVLLLLEKVKYLILPSRREGLPLVILEAIAKGVIPICSNVGGISEILPEKFLVKESNRFEEKFAKKVCEIIEDKITLKINIEKFTWGKIVSSDSEYLIQDSTNSNKILFKDKDNE